VSQTSCTVRSGEVVDAGHATVLAGGLVHVHVVDLILLQASLGVPLLLLL